MSTLSMYDTFLCPFFILLFFWRTWEKGDREAPLGRQGTTVAQSSAGRGTRGKKNVNSQRCFDIGGAAAVALRATTRSGISNKRLHTDRARTGNVHLLSLQRQQKGYSPRTSSTDSTSATDKIVRSPTGQVRRCDASPTPLGNCLTCDSCRTTAEADGSRDNRHSL